MGGSRGGGSGVSGPPLEFAKLNIADITGNEKNSYFSFLCTSTVIRQGWPPPPPEKFSGSALVHADMALTLYSIYLKNSERRHFVELP